MRFAIRNTVVESGASTMEKLVVTEFSLSKRLIELNGSRERSQENGITIVEVVFALIAIRKEEKCQSIRR